MTRQGKIKSELHNIKKVSIFIMSFEINLKSIFRKQKWLILIRKQSKKII